jgi:RNA polymerase sigma-70 factor (ECF subfamily)
MSMTRLVAFPDVAARLRARDPDAAADIVRRFGRRLAALARRRLHAAVRQRLDPEDVVQSAFRSFFQRHAVGQFDFDGWDDLWRLLACITARKCARKANRMRREMSDEVVLATRADWRPTPDEAASLADTLEHLLRDLSEHEHEILVLRLQGFSSSEVSQRLGCTERKVQRLVERLRERLRRLYTQTA